MKDLNTKNKTPLPLAFATVVWGGLLAGTLDAVDGVVAFGLRGMSPLQVLQYIASGLLGMASFRGGFKTAALGALLHYSIAFVVAGVYFAASLKLPALHEHPVRCGLPYGAAVYLFMNYVILPLSAVPKSSFALPLFLNGIVGHAILIGFVIAWFAHKSTRAIPPDGPLPVQEGVLVQR